MSRIGDAPITLSDSLQVTTSNSLVTVKGSKGELSTAIPDGITVKVADGTLVVSRDREERELKALHGLTRSLISNMVTGVTDGYEKKLEMVGTGYRAKKQGTGISLSAGFSHPVVVDAPEGITIDLEGDTVIVISGIDKQQVGQLAADIRAIRKPEPYKGKGIRYKGETIRRKAGKAAKTA